MNKIPTKIRMKTWLFMVTKSGFKQVKTIVIPLQCDKDKYYV
jgi:hypothetical protein